MEMDTRKNFWKDVPPNTLEEKSCCENPRIRIVDDCQVCLNCGTETGDREYDTHDSYAHDGSGLLLKQREPMDCEREGMKTNSWRGKKDFKGQPLSPHQQAKFDRLRKIQKHDRSPEEKNLSKALQIYRRLLGEFDFQDPGKVAWRICKWVARTKYSLGRYLETTTAAAVYAAMVEQGRATSYPAICCMVKVRPEALQRVVRDFRSGRPGNLPNFPVRLKPERFIFATRYVQQLCSDLHLGTYMEKDVREILEIIERVFPTGHRPGTKVAVAIFIASNRAVTWQELAHVSHINEPSLRDYWNKLNKKCQKKRAQLRQARQTRAFNLGNGFATT